MNTIMQPASPLNDFQHPFLKYPNHVLILPVFIGTSVFNSAACFKHKALTFVLHKKKNPLLLL
jgi:hypothetical protein